MGDETASTKNAVAWAEINGKFDRMLQSIDTVKDKQEEMAEIALMKAQSRRDALKKIGIGAAILATGVGVGSG